MNRHRNLKVWQLAGELIDKVYQLTRQLPVEERFVATSQMRRAAWSVQNNIAEGYAKRGVGELRRFFDSSLASLAEVDSMSAKLADLYAIEPTIVDAIEMKRRAITKLLFDILRRRGGA